MELTHEFRVAVPLDVAWNVLTDVERIAPCLPGAQLQEIEGEEYRGIVKVKVGPITAQYKGTATFVEQDRDAGRLVLSASGRDTRGQGSASAEITAQLDPDGDGTKVAVTTDLTITGKVAQFGRGVLADVSSKLLDQFVESLETTVLADVDADVEPEDVEPEPATEPAPAPAAAAPSAATAPTEAPKTRRIEGPEAKPVDLLDTAGAPVAKRVLPVLTALILVLFLGRRWRRRRARRS